MSLLRRTIHPVTRIVDASKGIVDYIASDETLDSYHEVIRASGWRFTNFQKNAPFVDSHDYQTIERMLGRVLEFRVEGRKLIERVKWAIDVPENKLAALGWKMTEAGYLKAVSVGFSPVRYLTNLDGQDSRFAAEWEQQLKDLGLSKDSGIRTIYLEQEQIELSACVIGANPNAVAKAYKAGVLNDDDLEQVSAEHARREDASPNVRAALMDWAEAQERGTFMDRLRAKIAQI
jgi:hypothetical protein